MARLAARRCRDCSWQERSLQLLDLAAVTRLLREHPPIDVELDGEGRLVAIRWNGQREPVEVCNAWRVAESWWREPIERDYCKVVGGRWLALVYLDRIDGTWHLERLYD
jgi:hypothetical protein